MNVNDPGHESNPRKRPACYADVPLLVTALVDGGKDDLEWPLAMLADDDARLPEVDPLVEKLRDADRAKLEGMLYCSHHKTYHAIEEFGHDSTKPHRHNRRYSCREAVNERKNTVWKRG